jgi:hypothetical protein
MRLTKDRRILPKGTLSISLEDGADEQECPREAVQVVGQGMYFQSRWHFAPCTQIEVTVMVSGTGRRSRRYRASGMVVACEQVRSGSFRTALHFIGPVSEIVRSRPGGRLASA